MKLLYPPKTSHSSFGHYTSNMGLVEMQLMWKALAIVKLKISYV